MFDRSFQSGADVLPSDNDSPHKTEERYEVLPSDLLLCSVLLCRTQLYRGQFRHIYWDNYVFRIIDSDDSDARRPLPTPRQRLGD